MSNFHVGERVVCIKSTRWRHRTWFITAFDYFVRRVRFPRFKRTYIVSRVSGDFIGLVGFLPVDIVFGSEFFRALVPIAKSAEDDAKAFDSIASHVRTSDKERA